MNEAPIAEEVPPEEVFAALADPTRVAVLRALWEADERTATFSELRAAVGMDDSGRFNYHLSKLRDRFITKTDDGYRLRLAGTRVVGALLSGAYTQTGSVVSVAMDQSCPFCDGTMLFEYEDERVTVACGGCTAVSIEVGVPPGVLAGYDRESLPAVAERYARNNIHEANEGFCTTCEGRIRPRIAVETPSERADLPAVPLVYYDCDRCGDTINADLGTAFLDHPSVVAFYYDHDIDVRETSLWRFVAIDVDSVRILDEEPLRVGVVYSVAGDRLTLTADGKLDVLAVERK